MLALLTPLAAAQDDGFAAFWKEFSVAAKAGDKSKVRALTKFPFLHYSDLRKETAFDRIWKNLFTAKARACLGRAKPERDKLGQYTVFCADSGFLFEKTGAGWRFSEVGVND
jgi:hypothetical protein